MKEYLEPDSSYSRTEQDVKEEQWERINYPHLFGNDRGGGFRKIKVKRPVWQNVKTFSGHKF